MKFNPPKCSYLKCSEYVFWIITRAVNPQLLCKSKVTQKQDLFIRIIFLCKKDNLLRAVNKELVKVGIEYVKVGLVLVEVDWFSRTFWWRFGSRRSFDRWISWSLCGAFMLRYRSIRKMCRRSNRMNWWLSWTFSVIGNIQIRTSNLPLKGSFSDSLSLRAILSFLSIKNYFTW